METVELALMVQTVQTGLTAPMDLTETVDTLPKDIRGHSLKLQVVILNQLVILALIWVVMEEVIWEVILAVTWVVIREAQWVVMQELTWVVIWELITAIKTTKMPEGHIHSHIKVHTKLTIIFIHHTKHSQHQLSFQ